MKNANRLLATVGAEDQQERIRQAIVDLSEALAHAKNVSANADTMVTHMKDGKGSVGALVMNEQLYDDVQELFRDLKHNPWKFLWKE